jgi:hypothetical protein
MVAFNLANTRILCTKLQGGKFEWHTTLHERLLAALHLKEIEDFHNNFKSEFSISTREPTTSYFYTPL